MPGHDPSSPSDPDWVDAIVLRALQRVEEEEVPAPLGAVSAASAPPTPPTVASQPDPDPKLATEIEPEPEREVVVVARSDSVGPAQPADEVILRPRPIPVERLAREQPVEAIGPTVGAQADRGRTRTVQPGAARSRTAAYPDETRRRSAGSALDDSRSDPGSGGALPTTLELEPDEEDDDASTVARRTRALLEWGAVILGALAVALLIKTFLVQAYYIPSPSMVPTLNENDRVLVNKLSYKLGDISVGDILVFHRPQEWDGTDDDLIKRVIAVGGQTLTIQDGRVYLDDQLLDESSYLGDLQTAGFTPTSPTGSLTNCENYTETSCTIPDGYIFVMGDNRPDSHDSRYEGPFSEDYVVGRAFIKVWPLSDIGGL